MTLIERDGNPRPESLADAASWERKGAPQFHHPHVFLPGLRRIMQQSYPDLLARILDAGVRELLFVDLGPDRLNRRCIRAACYTTTCVGSLKPTFCCLRTTPCRAQAPAVASRVGGHRENRLRSGPSSA